MMLQRKGDNEQDDYQFLVNMEAAIEALMSQRKLTKALECASHVLNLRKDFYGANSEEFVMFLKNLAKRTFQAAVQCLESNEGNQALTALKLLEEMLASQRAVEAFVTEICELYNQLACSYKRLDKPRLTKSYLEKALELSRTYKEAPIDRASLHLNMCAVLSGLSKHKEAVKYGASAVQYAQEELVNLKLAGETETSQKVTMLAVAYHNLAVEEEHLKNYDSALEWYNKAVSFMEAHGNQSNLLEEFKKSAAAAFKAYQKNKRHGANRPSSASNIRRYDPGLKRTLQRFKKQAHTDSSSSSSALRSSDREPRTSAYNATMKRSTSPHRFNSSSGFDTRYPLEIKPPTFEAIRMQQPKKSSTIPKPNAAQSPKQKAAIYSDQAVEAFRRDHDRQPEIEQIDSETEAELRELEHMGLLEYTHETPQYERARSEAVKVRGNPRKAVVTRQYSGKSSSESMQGLSRSQLSDKSLPRISSSRKGTPLQQVNQQTPRTRPVDVKIFHKVEPKKAEVRYSQPASSSESSSDSFEGQPTISAEVIERAALKIQAAMRGWKARKEVHLKKLKMKKQVLYRGGLKLADHVYATVTVKDQPKRKRILVVAESDGRRWKLRVDSGNSAFRLKPADLVSKLMLNERSQLVLRPEKPVEPHKPTEPAKPTKPVELQKQERKADSPEPEKPSIQGAPKPAISKNLLRGNSLGQEKSENFTAAYNVAMKPSPLPIEIIRESGKLTVKYTSGGEEILSALRDNVQGLSAVQAKAYIEQNVFPGLSVSEGKLKHYSRVLGTVEVKEQFDLSQYDPDKVALIQHKFRLSREKKQKREEAKQEALIAQGERKINGNTHLIRCIRTESKVGHLSKPQITITATPSSKANPTPKPLTLPLTELCEMLELRPEELNREAERLLNSVEVHSGEVSLNAEAKESFSSKELKHKMVKRLNTGREYDCLFFDVFEDENRKILIEAHCKDAGQKPMKPLLLSYAEVADTLDIEPSAVLQNLEEIGNLLIVEDAVELQLARIKPQGSEDVPMITISLTETNNILEPEIGQVVTRPVEEMPQVKFKLVKGVSPKEAAVKIQRHFRAKLSRDKVKLLKVKAAREEQSKLALRTSMKDENGVVYTLSIFAGQQAYEIRAENSTQVLTCKIDKVEIVDAKIKSDKEIVPMLKIAGNQLTFASRSISQTLINPIKTALKANFETQIKHLKTRKLLTLRSKTFEENIHMIAIFQTENGLLIECFKPEVLADQRIVSMSVTSHTLTEMFGHEYPLDEIVETLKLVNGQLILHPKDSPIKCVSNQNLLELTNQKPKRRDYSQDYETLYRQRIVTRGTKLFRNKLYVVVMSIERTKPDIDSVFNDSDKVTFEVLSSSSMEAKLQVSIDLKTASEITGLQKDMLLPIGNTIINRMLDIREGTVVIDPSCGPINCEQSASKIKAHLRGFVVRKNLQIALDKLRNDEVKPLLLKVLELNGKLYGVSVRLYDDEVKIEAANFESSMKVCVGIDIFNKFEGISPEKVAADFILPNLKIEEVDGTQKLTINPSIRKSIETQAKDTQHGLKVDTHKEPWVAEGGNRGNKSEDVPIIQTTPPKQDSPTFAKKPLKVFPTTEVKRMPRMGSLKNLIVPDSLPAFTIEYMDSHRSEVSMQNSDINLLDSEVDKTAIFDEYETVKSSVEIVKAEAPPIKAEANKPDQPKNALKNPVQVIANKIDEFSSHPAKHQEVQSKAKTSLLSRAKPGSPGIQASIDDLSPRTSESGSSIYGPKTSLSRLSKVQYSSRDFQKPADSYRGSTDGYTFAEPRLSSRHSSADNFKLIANPAFIHSSALNRRPPSDKSTNSMQRSQASDRMRASFESSDAEIKQLTSSHEVFFSPVSSAALTETSELLLRTGHKIDRVSFIVSLFRQNDHIKVEAISQRRGLNLTLNIVGSFPQSLSTQELDSICSSILTRLTLYRGKQGEVGLNLIPDELEEASSVLYKKFQYISNRYFVVTVKETSRGVIISAYEPDKKKTLECNLGKRNISDQHQIQEELERIAERLKVRKVLGDDVLIIGP